MLVKRSAGNNPFIRSHGTTQSGCSVPNFAQKAPFVLVLGLVLFIWPSFAAPPQQRSRLSGGDEESVKREVRHELVMLLYYGVFDNLEFQVNGPGVELMD